MTFFEQVHRTFVDAVDGEVNDCNYCPYLNDEQGVSAVRAAMKGIRFTATMDDGRGTYLQTAQGRYAPDASNLKFFTVNESAAAGAGSLLSSPMCLGGEQFQLVITLLNLDQYCNVQVTNWWNIGWSGNVGMLEADESALRLNEQVYTLPRALKGLRYGDTVFRFWLENFGQALGGCVLALGTNAMIDDGEHWIATQQSTWDWLADRLQYAPDAEE